MAMGGKCQCCGYSRCNSSLDFHHIDPTQKELSFGKVSANPRAWAVIVKELRKCILVCRNCHGEIHAGVRQLPETYAKFDETYAVYRVPKPPRPKAAHDWRRRPQPKRRKVERPSKEELTKMVWSSSLLGVGRQFGVRDNTIRKWCLAYGIELPPQGYVQRRAAGYSHEEAMVSQKRLSKGKRFITREIAEQAFAMKRDQGLSYRTVAAAFGFKHWGMQKAFERYGLEMAIPGGAAPPLGFPASD